jgi:hypothetical protein
MKIIKHHPDGVIYIFNATKRYVAKVSDFVAHAAAAGLDNPLIERAGFWQYDMALGFETINSSGIHGAPDVERWVTAENAIKAIDDLLEAQAATSPVVVG